TNGKDTVDRSGVGAISDRRGEAAGRRGYLHPERPPVNPRSSSSPRSQTQFWNARCETLFRERRAHEKQRFPQCVPKRSLGTREQAYAGSLRGFAHYSSLAKHISPKKSLPPCRVPRPFGHGLAESRFHAAGIVVAWTASVGAHYHSPEEFPMLALQRWFGSSS